MCGARMHLQRKLVLEAARKVQRHQFGGVDDYAVHSLYRVVDERHMCGVWYDGVDARRDRPRVEVDVVTHDDPASLKTRLEI